MSDDAQFDVIIVGAGIAGSLIAKQLGLAGKKVLVLEAGERNPPNIEAFMEQFYLSLAKTPGSPYPPPQGLKGDEPLVPDPGKENVPKPTVLTLGADSWKDPEQSYLDQQGPLPFASTYERTGGGTTRHWLGSSFRFLPNDFRMSEAYPSSGLPDWPITYEELSPWYDRAEAEIGVSADVTVQGYHGITFTPGYEYPMRAIPPTVIDQQIEQAVKGRNLEDEPLSVTSTPAGRNSQPYQSRRVCAGNTNCIPICPIQAKYDASFTLAEALETGNVEVRYQTVATSVNVGDDGLVSGVDYVEYAEPRGPQTGKGTVSAKRYVLAAHAIETPKILLNSELPAALAANGGGRGVANRSDQVGRNLMDHPLYLAWALSSRPSYPYRGPLATSGIESLRDGPFRDKRAAFRIEIGNEGWNFSIGDPFTTLSDFVDGTDNSRVNPEKKSLFGSALVAALNDNLTRQFRIGFLVEQSPQPGNRVTLSDSTDHLGIRRPEIHYDLSEYTKLGIRAARKTADRIFEWMGARQFTQKRFVPDPKQPIPPTVFEFEEQQYRYFGSGHVVGTYRMGNAPERSVVDRYQRSWDHANLFLVGSGVFPTVTTANPTLTIAALSVWAAETIKNDFEAPARTGSRPIQSPA